MEEKKSTTWQIVNLEINKKKNGSDLENGTLTVLFFLANGASAMNSYCRELLSPQTGITALTLTVMKGFEAKKGWLPCILPISVYSTYSSILRNRTSARSRTRVRRFAVRCSNHYATQLVPTKWQNVVFKLNVWKRQCLHSRGKKIPRMFHSPSHFEKKQVKPVKVVNYRITSMLQIPIYRTEPSYYRQPGRLWTPGWLWTLY